MFGCLDVWMFLLGGVSGGLPDLAMVRLSPQPEPWTLGSCDVPTIRLPPGLEVVSILLQPTTNIFNSSYLPPLPLTQLSIYPAHIRQPCTVPVMYP